MDCRYVIQRDLASGYPAAEEHSRLCLVPTYQQGLSRAYTVLRALRALIIHDGVLKSLATAVIQGGPQGYGAVRAALYRTLQILPAWLLSLRGLEALRSS